MTATTLTGRSASIEGLALRTRLAANEAGKGLRLMWRRRTMAIVGLAMNTMTYLGISLFIGGGHLIKPLMILTLPALLALIVAQTASLQGSGGIAEEINGGTLEQAQLSPASPRVQILGRAAALGVEGLVGAALVGTALSVGYGLHYRLSPAALVPAVLTVADALGYGLLIAALTVRVASIGAITHVFNMAIMLFAGMLVPVANFPRALETVVRFIPTTLGTQALNTTLAGRGLSAAVSDGTLPWLLVHAAVVLVAGLYLYARNIARAQREGGLSPR